MNWKNILASGALTGMFVAILIVLLFVLAEIDPGSFTGLCGGFFALVAISAVISNQIMKQIGQPKVDLKILISIGFLTSIMPLFGATLGLPNSDLGSLATLIVLGLAGGTFWSLPIVSWLQIHKSWNKSIENEE
tara:strand:+ start:1370 stop:1771 length:402 start_codon:yes stop_codon:yes gene_type:complete